MCYLNTSKPKTIIFMKFYIYVLLLAVLTGEVAMAQSDPLSGTASVVDADNRNPIKGATLRLLEANLKITSDRGGTYSFKINDLPATLLATYIGYEPQRMAI